MKANAINTVGSRKLILVSILITLFCSALGLISYQYSSNALQESICQSFENGAIDNARSLSQLLNEKLIQLEMIAEEDDMRSMHWETQKRALENHIKTLGVKWFRMTDIHGVSRATDGTVIDISDRAHFKKAIAGISNFSDVLVSRSDGSTIIVCATPIRNKNGSILGVLSYTIDYQVLCDMMRSIKIGQNGYAFMLNDRGALIAHPEKELVLSGDTLFEKAKEDASLREFEPIRKRIINGETGSGFFQNNGMSTFVSFTPVRGTNWFLVLSIPRHEIFSIIDSLKVKYFMQTIIFIFAALIMFYLVSMYWSQKKKTKELTEVDRMKTEFIANISHELRTPLSVILSSLKLFELYTKKGNIMQNIEKVDKHTQTMKQNCLRLLRLINNLIDITKIDGGFFELKPQYLDIVKLIKEITVSVIEYADGRGLGLEFNSEMEEKHIYCDPDLIERIILNLLSNAIKFTKAGGSIAVKLSQKEGNAVISVKDTGIGIPADKLELIFERFKQVEQTFTRSHEGSGIGLSLVKSLVKMHRGDIAVASEPGVGSEFIIALPEGPLAGAQVFPQTNYDHHKGADIVERIKVEFSDIYQKQTG